MNQFNSAKANQTALRMYHNARALALLNKVGSALVGRSRRLLNLADVRATCRVRSQHYAGIRTVPIRQIRGSEGRCGDFDASFRPLKEHNKERWMGLAAAQQLGAVLPPVELIQVGDAYFVRDGHHRISVAQAMGQQAVDAEVVVLDVAGPPSEERVAPSAIPAMQPV